MLHILWVMEVQNLHGFWWPRGRQARPGVVTPCAATCAALSSKPLPMSLSNLNGAEDLPALAYNHMHF